MLPHSLLPFPQRLRPPLPRFFADDLPRPLLGFSSRTLLPASPSSSGSSGTVSSSISPASPGVSDAAGCWLGEGHSLLLLLELLVVVVAAVAGVAAAAVAVVLP